MAKRPKIKGPTQAEPTPEMPPVTTPAEPKKSPYIRGSLYLTPAVHRQMRKLSYELNRSQHDLIQEAIDMLFERYAGKSRREVEAEGDSHHTG
jgi:antitoxin-like ribbon-helix-helix protein